MTQHKYDDIERLFRLLGLDSDSKREQMLRPLKSFDLDSAPEYKIHTSADTKNIQEEQNAQSLYNQSSGLW